MNAGANAIEEVFTMMPVFIEMIDNVSPSIEFDLQKYYTGLFREFEAGHVERIFNLVKINLTKGKKQGLYRENLDIELAAKKQVFIHTSKVDHKLVSYKELFDSKILKRMFIHHLRGICNEKGNIILEKKINEINQK